MELSKTGDCRPDFNGTGRRLFFAAGVRKGGSPAMELPEVDIPQLSAVVAPGSTPPQVKFGFALARSGYAQYPAYRGRAFVWLGFRRMQSDFFRAGRRPMGCFDYFELEN